MESRFYCTKCGKEGIQIYRRAGKERASSHLKKIWCLNCKAEVNHVETKEWTHYDKSCFDLEFNYGNFDEDGNRKEDFKQFRKRLREEGVINE